MNRNFLKKNVFILLASFAVFSCSNYMGLTIAERQELKIKDTPALTVQQLPTILPCKKVDGHYELEVIVIPEKNLRFPKSGDNYKIIFDAFVTNDVAITGLKATMMNMPNMTYDIPLENRIESNNGRITVNEDFAFPKEIPNLRIALKNLRIVAIVESAAEDGVTFTLTKQPARHIESENVEIDYVSFEAPPAEIGEVVVTLKNADGSVFTSITGKTGERLEIPQQIPVCRGWVFKKWIGVPEIFPQKNMEIEAEWELMDYYIDYELSGGVNSQENPDSYSEKNEAIKLWPATKEGSIFEGWYTDKNFENKIEVIQANRGEDITLYAKWIEVKIGQITLNPKTPVIVSGQKGEVEAHLVLSDGSKPAVTWTSDDESLATVDEKGNVTAQENLPFVRRNPVASIREVTVTATYDNLKASCKVKLIPTTLTRSIFQAIEPKYETIADYAVPPGIEELAAEDDGGTFEGRTNLKNVSLPDSLRVIGQRAFFGKTSGNGLTCNVNIPEDIERIDDDAFNSFKGQFAYGKIFGGRLTSIGNNAFRDSTADFSCDFPQSLLHIGDWAFKGCKNLKSKLSLPPNLEYLGSYAFAYCFYLTGSITIPSKITEIEEYVFYLCQSLSGNLQIPESVTSIGAAAFSDCSGLTGKLPLPNNLETLGYSAFSNCSGLTGSVIIPKKITKIEMSVFNGCTSLDGTISIPNSVTKIGASAFKNCSSLTGTLSIPNSVTEIKFNAFEGCEKLEKLSLSSNIKEIESSTFRGCSSLRGSLEIPAGVEEIHHLAFADCSSLEEVRIPGNGAIESITDDGWSHLPFYHSATIVTITGSLPSNRWDAKKWNSEVLYGFPELKELRVENLPAGYIIKDGVLFSSDEKKLVFVPNACGNEYKTSDGKNALNYIIPETVVEVCDYALYKHGHGFWWRSSSIPPSVTKIGDYAFFGYIAISTTDNIKYIGKNAFKNAGYEKRDENNEIIASTTKFIDSWYKTTSPDATSGATITTSNEEENYKNLTGETGYSDDWTNYYLKRKELQ